MDPERNTPILTVSGRLPGRFVLGRHEPALTSAAEHLKRLITFNTVSHRSNAELIAYAAAVFRAYGIEPVILPDPTGEKLGFCATVGPAAPGGVVLSGHCDVVPVEGQEWTDDPFGEVERDGRIYGRGSADMKGFIACCLAMVPEMARAELKRPLHVVISYDEETTCRGIIPTIDHMNATLPPISAVIVGEPTSMRIVTGHKGAYGYKVHVRGKPAHSSLAHQGVSANMVAARLVVWLDERQREAKAAAAAPGFEPPYTTTHVGTIHGGSACNILAADCAFEWDLRTVPGDDFRDVLAAFTAEADRLVAEAAADGHEISVEIVEDYAVPGLAPEVDGAAEALCRRLSGQNDVDVVSYSSEAGMYQERGLSTVLMGPGSIEQAHIADEFIELRQLEECTAFLGRLIDAQCA